MDKAKYYEHLLNEDYSFGSKLWYDSELKLKENIQEGNHKNAIEAYYSLEEGIKLRFQTFSTTQEMIVYKVGIIGGVIHFALRDAGVPPDYLTLMVLWQKEAQVPSAKYQSEEIINKTFLDCIKLACDLVKHFSFSNYGILVRKCMTYINNHITENISVSTIAQLLGVSRQHISTQFKNETSKTITEYINYQRIHLAKSFLQNKKLKISQIAFMCGFNDISYFIRIFKKYETITPSQYRIKIEK